MLNRGLPYARALVGRQSLGTDGPTLGQVSGERDGVHQDAGFDLRTLDCPRAHCAMDISWRWRRFAVTSAVRHAALVAIANAMSDNVQRFMTPRSRAKLGAGVSGAFPKLSVLVPAPVARRQAGVT